MDINNPQVVLEHYSPQLRNEDLKLFVQEFLDQTMLYLFGEIVTSQIGLVTTI